MDAVAENLIQAIVTDTDGWALVAIFLIYALLAGYRTHKGNEALRLMTNSIRDTLESLTAEFQNLAREVGSLTAMLGRVFR